MNDKSIAGPFMSWQFVATAVIIYAIQFTFVKMGRAYKPLGKLQAKAWFQGFIMTPMNVVLGLLFAIPKGWLVPADQKGRFILGACAGFLSLFIYTMLKKRVEVLVGAGSVADPDPKPANPKPVDPKDSKPTNNEGKTNAGED